MEIHVSNDYCHWIVYVLIIYIDSLDCSLHVTHSMLCCIIMLQVCSVPSLRVQFLACEATSSTHYLTLIPRLSPSFQLYILYYAMRILSMQY